MKLINPKPIFIHETSPEVTQKTTIANELTPVVEILVPEGFAYRLDSGLVLNGHFKNGSDAFDGDGVKLALAYKKPGDSMWKPIEYADQVMGGFNNTTKELQQNKENDAGRRFIIKDGHILFTPKDKIAVMIEGGNVPSWTYSHFKLPVIAYQKR